jgi:hypothetical protein
MRDITSGVTPVTLVISSCGKHLNVPTTSSSKMRTTEYVPDATRIRRYVTLST